MSVTVEHGVDRELVKKAADFLLTYHKTKTSGHPLVANKRSSRVSLLLNMWKIPSEARTINICFPHGILQDTVDICLFTKDEPNMSTEETETFYKSLLSRHGVTQKIEIIPLKKVQEWQPSRAMRQLMSGHRLFLADDGVCPLLTSHLGTELYKREPLSVNLKSDNLAAELNRVIQEKRLHITNKGFCSEIHVGHTDMEVDDIVENTLTVIQDLAKKLPETWKNIKAVQMSNRTCAALPIYSSSSDPPKESDSLEGEKAKTKKRRNKRKKKNSAKVSKSGNEETLDQPDEGGDSTRPHKEQDQPDNVDEEERSPTVEGGARRRKPMFKKNPVEEKMNGSKNIQASSTKKSTPKKRKMNESEEVINLQPSKPTKEVASEEKSSAHEELKTPPMSSKTPPMSSKTPPMSSKTPPTSSKTPPKTASKSATKLTNSARKAPQTPKPN